MADTIEDKQAPEFEQLLYEHVSPGVVRITMNRPERRNAQGVVMTYELDRAFAAAAHDDDVKVIILAGAGEDFNAGHDLSYEEKAREGEFPPKGLWSQNPAPGWEWGYGREKEIYLEITERWRNLPKPTIAQVQGHCIAGGIMLAFACDLIIASEDAQFKDHTLDMGVCGAEFFNHPYELGIRKAKEWLFTSDYLGAQEAKERGMVNHVVPRDELADFTLKLAQRIAKKPMLALKLTKEAVNAAQDAMGRPETMKTSFALHEFCHAQNMLVHGFPIAFDNLHPKIQESIKKMLAKHGGKYPLKGKKIG